VRFTELEKKRELIFNQQEIIHKSYNDYFNVEAQEKVLKFLELVVDNIDSVFDDFDKCRTLLNLIIEEIVIYSQLDNEIKLP
jgi:cell division septum initiation protein DivIVA